MAISMQGAWTVSVQSKNASFPQRFLIEGASSGNGTYSGDTSTPAVAVDGVSWSIRIQHDPGDGWIDSDDQLTTPSLSGGQYRFSIQSNDSGGDEDFNDLVLRCETPATATDFLLYGNVRTYRGRCIFNPCFPRFVVVDSVLGLQEALKHPALRDRIKKLYPERLKPQPPVPPDPPPFKPIVFSIDHDTPLPPKQELVTRVAKPEPVGKKKVSDQPAVIRSFETRASGSSATLADNVGIASLIDRIRLFCTTEPAAGVVLRFQEYDRTAAELAGGAYTGEGDRENLGVTVTDRNGNYVFRFTRTLAEFFDEADVDTAPGETEVVQSAPDVIVQLIDVMASGGVLYETAPYFNVPNFKRINICIPESRLNPSKCVKGQIIQAVGRIFIGPPQAGFIPIGQPKGYGARVGFNNSLGVTGRITARNTTGPQTRCAAWAGTLDLFACFLDHPDVERYTIRYRPHASGAWTFFSQELRHPEVAKVGVPGYSGTLIGASPASLHVDGGPAVLVPSYENIESNPLYVSTHRDRRAQIRSWLLSVPTPGSVQFRIEGYNGAGARVAGAEDSITLYIDNSAPFLDVDEEVTMGSATLGNCAKFKLPAGQPGAPLTVKFKADQAQGFLQSYSLGMNKGATGGFAVTPPPPAGAPFRTQTYAHGDDLACSQLRGTFDDPTHDLVTGYVTIDLAPASGQWLEAGQTFCAFSINLGASTRVTDGYGGGKNYNAVPVLIGIEA